MTTAVGTAPPCPKAMTYGPCGGVALDGACETGAAPCSFLDRRLVAWTGTVHAVSPADDPLLAVARSRPLVVVDLPDRPLDAASTRRAAAALRGSADAVLLGDAGWSRLQFPPSYRASLVAAEGVRPWAGVNCRDRNRVALEAELGALADLGAAIHCVTGDHTSLGHRADAQAVFDLDSTRLAALARARGALVSVAENPVAPPRHRRAARLMEKLRAGAQVCFVNHPGDRATVALFVAEAVALGAGSTPFIVCLPVLHSAECVERIRTFTGLALPAGLEEAVLGATDPFAIGVERAVAFARDVLQVPGVVGVNLSATYPPGDEDRAVQAALAVIGELAR